MGEVLKNIDSTEKWLKTVFSINRELDFERENVNCSLKRIKELEAKKKEIYRIIGSITNPTYKQILHKRYVQGKKWEDVSAEMHYELPHIHRLHKGAVGEAHKLRQKKEISNR